MRNYFAVAASLLAVASTVLAAPQNDGFIDNVKLPGNHSKELKEYIITFQRGEVVPRPVDELLDLMEMKKTDDTIVYESTNNYTKVVIVKMCEDHAKTIEKFAEINVVEEKTEIQSYFASHKGAPWGLQRLSNDAGASGFPGSLDFTYSFEDESLGKGVDIYVLDTGIRTSHAIFTGRASQGIAFNGSDVDGDGHGTHCAGTAAGADFGVASGANVIAVKILGDDGSGSSSDCIKGIDWVITNHEKRKTQPGFVGSVISMSWGLQGLTKSVDEVIAGASQAGIHVSVAAGNEGVDACRASPSHLGGANSNVVTVGSINIMNQVSIFSNVGSCVDIYAPGEQILSAWATNDTVVAFLSGTSMACPHATGVMAYLIAEDPAGLGQNPAALKAKLLQTARQGQISGALNGSANLMLSNSVNGAVTRRLIKNYVVPDLNGSPAARAIAAINGANDVVIDKRFQLHSRNSVLRF